MEYGRFKTRGELEAYRAMVAQQATTDPDMAEVLTRIDAAIARADAAQAAPAATPAKPAPVRKGDAVEFTADGNTQRGTVTGIQPGKVRVQSADGATLTLPRASVRKTDAPAPTQAPEAPRAEAPAPAGAPAAAAGEPARAGAGGVEAGGVEPAQAPTRPPRSHETQELISLRKRESVLRALVECLA